MTGWNADFFDEKQLRQLGFRKLGRDVLIHRAVVLVDCAGISIGDHVRVDPFTIISAADVEIGSHVHIAAQCCLTGSQRIEIADFAGLSHGSKFFSSNDDYSGAYLTGPTIPKEFTNITSGPVRIGRHAVVGAGSIVLPGVEIADGSAVGALSLVNLSLDGWKIYAGVPVRYIRDREKGVLDLERQLRNV